MIHRAIAYQVDAPTCGCHDLQHHDSSSLTSLFVERGSTNPCACFGSSLNDSCRRGQIGQQIISTVYQYNHQKGSLRFPFEGMGLPRTPIALEVIWMCHVCCKAWVFLVLVVYARVVWVIGQECCFACLADVWSRCAF